MRQSMKWLTASVFLVLSGPTVTYAAGLPAEQLAVDWVKSEPGRPDTQEAARLWRQVFGIVTNQIQPLWDKYGPGRKTMTPEEHECLRQKLSEFFLESTSPYMSTNYKISYGELLHRLRKQDGDRCPKGNAGLAAFKAWARDEASKLKNERSLLAQVLEDGKRAAQEHLGRPLTPAEVAAITAAILFSAPVWALP